MKVLALGSALVCLVTTVNGGPLTEARVNKIINDVSVVDPQTGARAATLNEVIKEQTGLKTGIKSRSELLFQDNTLTRVGPETYFSFTPGTRDMTLKSGTMLLQVPKGLGGAKIRTAAVTAAITGTTILLEHRPGKHIKVLVLEGSLRLSVNGTFGDSLLLTPGKMVIMPPDAKRIPDPVAVDLANVIKTSSLVKMSPADRVALPSMPLIQREIELQARAREGEGLIATNLVIKGGGTNVVVEEDPTLRSVTDRSRAGTDRSRVGNGNGAAAPTPPPAPAATPGNTPNPFPAPGSTPAPSATPASTPTSSATPGSTPNPSATPGSTPTPAPSASPTPHTHGDDDDDDDDNDDADEHDSDEHDSDDDVEYDQVKQVGDDESNTVIVRDPIDLSAGGKAGKVKIHAKGTIGVDTSVKVSESAGTTPSQRGGRIDIKSHKTNGTAIAISSSGDLLSLLNAAAPGPGGLIRFRSAGGAINVNGAKLQADRGTIDIKNSGGSGAINLADATLNADTVKVRALGANGQLNIGGGTISADTAIQLYAGGSNGTVNFTDNVTLSGNSVKTISGDTVTIFNGKTVTINGSGPASVFTNNPNYSGSGGNGSTTGIFGGQGATTAPFASRPGE